MWAACFCTATKVFAVGETNVLLIKEIYDDVPREKSIAVDWAAKPVPQSLKTLPSKLTRVPFVMLIAASPPVAHLLNTLFFKTIS